jgi:hypothetical protein
MLINRDLSDLSPSLAPENKRLKTIEVTKPIKLMKKCV